MTSFRPGHNPPHVTTAQVVLEGSKKILSRGPERSIVIGSCPFSREEETLSSE
jgi:hypothetical protein